jgi:hypothetical protein
MSVDERQLLTGKNFLPLVPTLRVGTHVWPLRGASPTMDGLREAPVRDAKTPVPTRERMNKVPHFVFC